MTELAGGHGALWRTRSGLLVRQRGVAVQRDGKVKIHAYRDATGGYHGLLSMDRLEFVSSRDVEA